MYRTHAATLVQTGGGVRPDDDGADENTHHEFSDCYIPATGPDGTTTERAKNLWRTLQVFFRLNVLGLTSGL